MKYALTSRKIYEESDEHGRDYVHFKGKMRVEGIEIKLNGTGNGPIDAFSNALSKTPAPHFSIAAFHEHSVGSGNDTSAYAYIQITCDDGKKYWGVGKSTNIGRAGIDAVVSALNQIQ